MPRTYAAELIDEPGLAGRAGSAVARLMPARRSDLFMLLIAVAASATVLVNALALQGGRHRLPDMLPGLLGGEAVVPLPVPVPPEARQVPTPPPAPQQAAPQPAAAPAARPVPKPAVAPAKPATPPKPPAAVRPAAAKPTDIKSADFKPLELAPPPAVIPARAPAQTGIGALSSEIIGSVRPPAEMMSPRVLAVQKALADIGYGPIRIDGRGGAATKEAIERFERDRRLPISGEVSDRVVRELNAVAGTSIE